MSEQTETMLKNIREGMAMDGQAPHALTREQVEKMGFTIHSADEFGGDGCYQVLRGPGSLDVWITEPEDRNFHRDLFPLVQLIACQHQALTQQAQEVEEQKGKLINLCHAHGNALIEIHDLKQEVERLNKLIKERSYRDEANATVQLQLLADKAKRIDDLKQQLAAMTAERDAWESKEQALQKSNTLLQQRAKELEEHEKQTHERLGAILGTHDSLEQCAKQLKATPAELDKKAHRYKQFVEWASTADSGVWAFQIREKAQRVLQGLE